MLSLEPAYSFARPRESYKLAACPVRTQAAYALAHHIFRAVCLQLTSAADCIEFTQKWTEATRALWSYQSLRGDDFQPSWHRIVSDTVSNHILEWTPKEALEMYAASRRLPARHRFRSRRYHNSKHNDVDQDLFLLSLTKDSDDGLTDFLFNFNLREGEVHSLISLAPNALETQELQALLIDQVHHERYQTLEQLKSFRVPERTASWCDKGWSTKQVKEILQSLWHPPLVAGELVHSCLRRVCELDRELVDQRAFQRLFEKIYSAKHGKEEFVHILVQKCVLNKCSIQTVALLTRWCLARDDKVHRENIKFQPGYRDDCTEHFLVSGEPKKRQYEYRNQQPWPEPSYELTIGFLRGWAEAVHFPVQWSEQDHMLLTSEFDCAPTHLQNFFAAAEARNQTLDQPEAHEEILLMEDGRPALNRAEVRYGAEHVTTAICI